MIQPMQEFFRQRKANQVVVIGQSMREIERENNLSGPTPGSLARLDQLGAKRRELIHYLRTTPTKEA